MGGTTRSAGGIRRTDGVYAGAMPRYDKPLVICIIKCLPTLRRRFRIRGTGPLPSP